MPNETYALEWLNVSKKNLDTAQLLYQENHYTDIIAIEIQQAIEKALKAILAFNGLPIPRSHSLLVIFEISRNYIHLDDIVIDDIIEISDYFETERYPGPGYFIPGKSEIEKNLIIADKIYKKVSDYILQRQMSS
jgi:HEPN domain-containing protein